jgi:predicted site-specific integrase-resolvase
MKENFHQVESPITLNQARAILNNVSKPVLRRWIREGKIRYNKAGKNYFFFASQIVEDLKNF